jgi:urease accessory protein
VRTVVEVVARAGYGGRTVLPVLRSSGQLAVRHTGPASVHLVATAFGPLGGDDMEISLIVEEGAALTVRSVAAAIALPARENCVPSSQRITASVGGSLDLGLEPTVVAARAHHLAELTVELGPDGVLTATEQVLLGRAGEDPGRWTGTVRVVREGVPLLHTAVGLGPGAPAWLPPVAPRAYASTVHLADDKAHEQADVRTGDDAVRLPLPGGWAIAAWGAELHHVVRAAAHLTPVAPVRMPA